LLLNFEVNTSCYASFPGKFRKKAPAVISAEVVNGSPGIAKRRNFRCKENSKMLSRK